MGKHYIITPEELEIKRRRSEENRLLSFSLFDNPIQSIPVANKKPEPVKEFSIYFLFKNKNLTLASDDSFTHILTFKSI